MVRAHGSLVTHVPQERRGLSASRNLALELVTTPFIALTDDDCAVDPDWVRAIVAAFGAEPRPDAVTGPILPLGPPPAGAHAVSLRTGSEAVDHVGRVLPWLAGSGANLAGRVGALRDAGGWDERLGTGTPGRAAEDADLNHRILRGGGRIRYAPDAIVRHEWQDWDTRLDRRAGYAFGVGAMAGIWLRRHDAGAVRALGAYAWMHVRDGALALGRGDRPNAREHGVALSHLPRGLRYGLTCSARGS